MVDKNKNNNNNNNNNNSSNAFVFGLWPQTKTAMLHLLEEHGKRRTTEMVERIKRPQFEPTTFQFKDW